MPKAKHIRFNKFTLEGRRFIQIWNKADRDGYLSKLAAEFDISIMLVWRISKKLGLEPLHSGRHPGRRKLIKKIKRYYWRGRSSIMIGRTLKMNPENVRKILRSQNVKMNPKHVINPLYFPFKNNPLRSHLKMVKLIKEEYENGETAANIARKYGLDQGAVSKKLKALGVELRQNHRHARGGYPCYWCGKIMSKVWIKRGPRKQKYCSGSCKNKAKDLRRLIKGQRSSEARLAMKNNFLRETWGPGFHVQIDKILGGGNFEAISHQ